MDEFDRVARLRAALATDVPSIRLGIGDDAAVVDVAGSVVLSNDTSIENVHFRREFGPLDRLARRALHAAASDLAAMGSEPVAMLVALALPSWVDDAAFDALVAGMRLSSRELGMPIVGGNLSAASELGITTTVVGRVEGTCLRRDGARPGDAIYVSGCVGAAAVGLRSLLAGDAAPGDPFVEAWLGPCARLDVGRRVRDFATSAIDVSDGLSQDLGHILEASRVGAVLDATRLPCLEGHAERCARLGVDAVDIALTGGEDYQLLFTARPDAAVAGLATCIGRIESEPGLRVDRGEGPRPFAMRGHRHWR